MIVLDDLSLKYLKYAAGHGLVRSVCRTRGRRVQVFDHRKSAYSERPMLITERLYVCAAGIVAAPLYVPTAFWGDVMDLEKLLRGLYDAETDCHMPLTMPITALF